MNLGVFASGMVLGFAFSAPIGPIGVLCVRKTLTEKRLAGMAVGLGAAAADALYATIAACGFTLASRFFAEHQLALRSCGGLLLLAWGLKLLLRRQDNSVLERFKQRAGILGSAVMSFILTLTNPATIIAFTLAFSSIAVLGQSASLSTHVLLVSGVFLGAVCWWSVLTAVALRLKRWITNLGVLNRVCGVLLVVFGLVLLTSTVVTILSGN